MVDVVLAQSWVNGPWVFCAVYALKKSVQRPITYAVCHVCAVVREGGAVPYGVSVLQRSPPLSWLLVWASLEGSCTEL